MSGIVLAVCVCAGCGDGCAGCGSEEPLAELIEATGRPVERDFAAAVGKWGRAEVGSRFALGDGIRVGKTARATLRLAGGAIARLRPGAAVRFLGSAGEAHTTGLDVQVGEAEIEVGAADLALGTPLGVATLRAGSRVTLGHVSADRMLVRVEFGAALLQSDTGEVRELGTGQRVEVGIGMATFVSEVAPTVQADGGRAADRDSGYAPVDGAVPVDPGATTQPPQDGPTRVSVQAPLGESFTVHAARLPVAVAFGLGDLCPRQAVLLVDRKHRTRGLGRVAAALAAGAHRYEVRCLADDGREGAGVGSGTVTVLRDAGTAKLPARAATAHIEADGKRYTVMYQNLLPRIVASWPGAAEGATYTLSVDSRAAQSKRLELHLQNPRFAFAPGALREGTHTLQFSDAAGQSSRPTTLEIRFDNAAPRASVRSPTDRGFAAGEPIEVSGVVLPGSKVSLAGRELPLDPQSRFASTLVTTGAEPDVALRIESAHGGVHYFVRRAAGSGE